LKDQEEEIMVIKSDRLMFIFLISCIVLSACGQPSQGTEEASTPTIQEPGATVPASPAVSSQVIVTPTAEFHCPEGITEQSNKTWHIVVLNASDFWGLGEAYAALVEKCVGVKVELSRYAIGNMRTSGVLSVLRQQEPTISQLADLPTALSEADVVIMGGLGSPDISLVSGNLWDMDACVSATGPPKNCNPASMEQLISDLKFVWAEIFKLRNNQPTILRAVDVYVANIGDWNEEGITLACTRCFENYSNAVRIAAEAYHIPFLSRYDVFNGVNHDEDPIEKGYLVMDGIHPSELGAQMIAERLVQMGFAPVPPP
jgi:hypothetical protein